MKEHSLFQLRSVERHLGQTFVLRIEHLNIAPRQVFCVLGPTGAGKSTLLRLLTGLEPADMGTVVFDKSPWQRTIPDLVSLRRIALVPQRPLLITGTVRANVEYGLRVRGTINRGNRVDEMLARLGIAPSLVLDPEVLLLDEPTSNLDPARVALVEEVVLQMQQQRPMTVVWATHNLFQARRVAQQVGLLLNGELIDVAPTPSFFEAPGDERSAQFIQGKMVY
jgi:tungstate transport system ATP-binding protein